MAGGYILIVDDDDDIREILEWVLGSEGYLTSAARDGFEALERLGEGGRPELIILDMMMPRMDGEAFLRALHREPAWASTPVLILSGHHAARDRAAQLSAAACVVKPIDIDELLLLVQRFAPRPLESAPAAPG